MEDKIKSLGFEKPPFTVAWSEFSGWFILGTKMAILEIRKNGILLKVQKTERKDGLNYIETSNTINLQEENFACIYYRNEFYFSKSLCEKIKNFFISNRKN